jgi:hypothetical protein
MNFEIGDETDKALTTTLVHELVLCTDSFERFVDLAKMNIMGRSDKTTKIKCHDAYASFLHHLYEFYVGCFKRDLRSTKPLESRVLDQIFNREVTKLLKNRVDAIKGGYAPSWENHISVYQVDVPNEFGTQLRNIRNRTAHASTKRSSPEDELPLGQFYEKYHRFVYLLYYSAQGFWAVKDIEARDWKSIEDFDLAVLG